ncbi:MAG TPA: penicillin acylase family protein, partial [Spirochaetota bacterium]
MRRIVYVIVVAAVLAACGVASWFFILPHFLGDSLSYDDTVRSETRFPVRIVRDRYGVPDIIASDRNDLLFSLGYVHAQDRLNIMEYYRAIASGLSDRIIKGDDGKMLSRLVFILGVAEKSRDIYSSLKEPYRGYLDSYVRGINAWRQGAGHTKYIRNLPDDRQWSPEDVIALYLVREWSNAYLNNQELLFPLTDKKNTPSLNDFFQIDYITPYKEKYYPYVNVLRFLSGAITRCLGEDGESFSILMPSYSKEPSRILIHQERAEEGFPVQFPLRFTYNNIRYCAVSEAGIPFLSSVISDSVSYSTASARLDSIDFYIVPVEKRDGEWFYSSGNQSKELITKDSKTEAGVFSFRSTDFGPLISDIVHLENETIGVVIDPLKGSDSDLSIRFDLPFLDTIGSAINAVSSLQGYPHSFLVSSGGEGVAMLSGTMAERKVKGIMFHDGGAGSRQIQLSSYRAANDHAQIVSSSRISESEYPALRDYSVYRFTEKQDLC